MIRKLSIVMEENGESCAGTIEFKGDLATGGEVVFTQDDENEEPGIFTSVVSSPVEPSPSEPNTRAWRLKGTSPDNEPFVLTLKIETDDGQISLCP